MKNRKNVFVKTKEENTETDVFFSDSNILNAIKQGIEDVKAGRITQIRDPKNIWAEIVSPSFVSSQTSCLEILYN